MNHRAIAAALVSPLAVTVAMAGQVQAAEGDLRVVYPPDGRETASDRIFIIGSGDPAAAVTINGQAIRRSPSGNFAPSFPLRVGPNQFEIRHGSALRRLTVNRLDLTPQVDPASGLVLSSLAPTSAIARPVGEPICWSALGVPGLEVVARLGDRAIPLTPQPTAATLPDNSAALVGNNEPLAGTDRAALVTYGGCGPMPAIAVTLPSTIESRRTPQGAPIRLPAAEFRNLHVNSPTVVEVTARPAAIARTGPSTNHSRLTPLPTGTRAAVTGREGDWLRLDYGAWILAREAQELPGAIAPHSHVRSLRSVRVGNTTEIRIPLEVPVPLSLDQGRDWLSLTLHSATAQTDTIAVGADPIIERLDWSQPEPGKLTYRLSLKGRSWGYGLRYEGTTLVWTLNHPPATGQAPRDRPLTGTTILLDPGHGGAESGSVGPTGYPEKDANLVLSQLLTTELEGRGARVLTTRTADQDVSLPDRQAAIARARPTVALSIHYNALPDSGNAETTQGIGMFWYHPQAQDLAEWLHDSLTAELDRPSYGVFWGNLALARPTEAPSVLMELGFMINPEEFEWITAPAEQQRLARAIADALAQWIANTPQG
jgi:N-acetylmuramoyl-L-alanine amidase